VIGCGVKNSTSDLLIANCDEFIYYDDLVREQQQKPRRQPRKKAVASQPGEGKEEDRMHEAFDLVLSTIDALVSARDAGDKIWSSMVKQAIKRQRPGFNESYYGFRTFNKLLEEAAARKLLSLERDDKSGNYLIHSNAEGL
jgi:hypothetical protein